jgi:sugar phosphate isomerase/epimerase
MKYIFPLAVQLTLPEDYENTDFHKILELLQELGFSGVELNIVRYDSIDPQKLKAYLAGYGLVMSQYATGGAANALGLSLSSENEQKRRLSISKCREFIDFASSMGSGLILGYIKGGISKADGEATIRFKEAIDSLSDYILQKQTPFLIEATNRYETSVVNTLDEAAYVIEGIDNEYLRILPDTFHMNIEELNMYGVLSKYRQFYDSIHISDNNRFFPGLGSIDFYALIKYLKIKGYNGWLAIEGNIFRCLEEDIRKSVEMLAPVLI